MFFWWSVDRCLQFWWFVGKLPAMHYEVRSYHKECRGWSCCPARISDACTTLNNHWNHIISKCKQNTGRACLSTLEATTVSQRESEQASLNVGPHPKIVHTHEMWDLLRGTMGLRKVLWQFISCFDKGCAFPVAAPHWTDSYSQHILYVKDRKSTNSRFETVAPKIPPAKPFSFCVL